MSGKIIERIQMLLRKAESTDYEAERQAYSEAAEKLMLKHNIDMAVIEAESGEEDDVVKITFAFSGVYATEDMYLVAAAVQAIGARVYYAQVGKQYLVTVLEFTSQAALTRMLLESLRTQAHHAMKVWWKGIRDQYAVAGASESQKLRARKSFLAGFRNEVALRLARVKAEAEAEAAEAGALVLAREARLDDAMPATQTRRSRHRDLDRNGLHAGTAAGREANLTTASVMA